MDKINELLTKINEIISNAMGHVIDLLSGEYYIIYGAIGVLLVITVLVGLVTCFKKAPRVFTLLIIALTVICLYWYFFMHSSAS